MSAPARAPAAVALRARARAPVTVGLAGKGVELATQVLLVTALPAAMGAHDYGTFAVALSVVMIGSASMTLGGPSVMSRYVPGAAPADRDGIARALMVRIGWWRLAEIALALVTGAVLVLAAPDTFPPAVTGFVVAALALDVLASLGYQTALGFGHTATWSFRFPLQNGLLVAFALGLYSLAGTTAAIAGIALASAGALVVAGARVLPRVRRAPAGAAIPAGALRFGLLQGLSGALLQLQNRGGIVAVSLLAGSSKQAGYASLAIGLGLAPTGVVRQTFSVQLPALVERDRDEAGAGEAAARRLAGVWVLIMVPAALAAALLVGDLLEAIGAEDFRGATTAFGPALALLPLAPLMSLVMQVSTLRLRPGLRLRATAAGTAVFAAAAVALVPWMGAPGATSALLAGTGVTVLAAARMLPGVVSARLAAAAGGGAALVVLVGVLVG